MNTWKKLVRLLCLAFFATGVLQARAYAQGFCHGPNPQMMPVEVASDEEGFRHFRMGCAPGNQIDTLISRVNASIRNPADHVNMEHFIDSNLRKIGYMCRVGSGDRRNMIHNSRFGMSMQDYTDRYCQEGEAHPYVIPGTVLRIPATGIKTPTQVVRDLTAEVQARASIDPSYLDMLYQRLEAQERRTDATPITREARLGFTAAIRAKLSTLAVAPTVAPAAPVQNAPVRAGSTRIVYAPERDGTYKWLFYITLCFSFGLFGLLVMAKRANDRLPLSVSNDDEIDQLSNELNKKIEQFEAKCVETARLVTELGKVKAENEGLKAFADSVTERALQIFGGQHPVDRDSAKRLVMTVFGFAEKYEKLRKGYDALMQRMKKGALAERYSRLPETFGGHEDDILRIFTQLESNQKSLVASEQQHEAYDTLSQKHLGKKFNERLLEDLLLRPSTMPSGSQDLVVEQEKEDLRTEIAALRQSAGQFFAIVRELARSMNVEVDKIPPFDAMSIEQSSDTAVVLYNRIMAKHDQLEQDLSQSKSALAELKASHNALIRDFEAASALASEESVKASEAGHALMVRERELTAKIEELNLLKVQLNDAQTALNSAEGIRRGLTFRMTELDTAKTALEQEHATLVEGYNAIHRENDCYRRFCEDIGGDLVLSMTGLSESLARAPAIVNSPHAADADQLKQHVTRFFKEMLELPTRARDFARAPVEAVANVVATYPIAAGGRRA